MFSSGGQQEVGQCVMSVMVLTSIAVKMLGLIQNLFSLIHFDVLPSFFSFLRSLCMMCSRTLFLILSPHLQESSKYHTNNIAVFSTLWLNENSLFIAAIFHKKLQSNHMVGLVIGIRLLLTFSATRRRPIKGAAGRPVQFVYPDTPISPTTLERREVTRRLVPIHIQILVFLVIVFLLYLIYVFVDDDSLDSVGTLLDDLKQFSDSEAMHTQVLSGQE